MASYTLGDICELINGGAWKQSEYTNDGIPVVQVSNMKNGTIDISDLKFLSSSSIDRYKKHMLKKDDLLIATVGSHATQASAAGRATIVKENASGMLLNQNAVAVRSKSKVLDQRYLGLLGSSDKFQSYLDTVGKGAANQVRIALSAIRQFKCDLPPIGEQQRVVEIISGYDDLIENNRRRIALLERAARLLYREWFVRLRFPGHEHVRIEDGVPEGWEKMPLGDLLTLQRGFDLPAKNREEGPYPIYASTGINGYHKVAKVKGPGIVTGRSGSLGTVMYVTGDFWPLNTTLWVKEFKRVDPLFALHLLSGMKLEQYNRGAAVPTLNRNDVHRIEVLCPSRNILSLFDEYLSPLYQQIEMFERCVKFLARARDLLLPRLMNGEIPV